MHVYVHDSIHERERERESTLSPTHVSSGSLCGKSV